MHQEHRRREEVRRADPVRRVKQAPEPTVHARHAKQVNIVRVPMLMLPNVSTAHKVFLKPCKAGVTVCPVCPENMEINREQPLVKIALKTHSARHRVPLPAAIVHQEQRRRLEVRLALHQQPPVDQERRSTARFAKPAASRHPAAMPVGRVKQVPEPMVHASYAKQVNTVQVPWLQRPARTAPLDFPKVILGKCRAPFAVLVSSTMLWGPWLVKHARCPRFPM